eukprot:364731-Chlamydomonas_euryale.AAC.6
MDKHGCRTSRRATTAVAAASTSVYPRRNAFMQARASRKRTGQVVVSGAGMGPLSVRAFTLPSLTTNPTAKRANVAHVDKLCMCRGFHAALARAGERDGALRSTAQHVRGVRARSCVELRQEVHLRARRRRSRRTCVPAPRCFFLRQHSEGRAAGGGGVKGKNFESSLLDIEPAKRLQNGRAERQAVEFHQYSAHFALLS